MFLGFHGIYHDAQCHTHTNTCHFVGSALNAVKQFMMKSEYSMIEEDIPKRVKRSSQVTI